MKIIIIKVEGNEIKFPKLLVGESISVFDRKLRVVESKTENDCNECEIHHLCNRDYLTLKKVCKELGGDTCADLIGIGKHFIIV